MSPATSEGTQRRWLAWSAWTTTVVLVAVSVVLPPNTNTSDTLGGLSLTLLLTVQALTFATVGHQPRPLGSRLHRSRRAVRVAQCGRLGPPAAAAMCHWSGVRGRLRSSP